MTMGTKSLLFGVNCLLTRPLLLAWAWSRIASFPWRPRLWLCLLLCKSGWWGSARYDQKSRILRQWRGAALFSYLFEGCRGRFSAYSGTPASAGCVNCGGKAYVRGPSDFPSGWLGACGRMILLQSGEAARFYRMDASLLLPVDALSLLRCPRLTRLQARMSGEWEEWRFRLGLLPGVKLDLSSRVRVTAAWLAAASLKCGSRYGRS